MTRLPSPKPLTLTRCWLIVLMPWLCLACASTPERIVLAPEDVQITYSDIEEESARTLATEGTVPRATIVAPLSTEEALEGVDRPRTTREALDRALEWAAEGLRLYDQGNHEAARKSLEDARIILLEADLPEAIQDQGLAVLGCALPSDLGGRDLEAVLLELEDELRSTSTDLPERDHIEREVRRLLRRFDSRAPDDAYLQVFVDEVERYINYYQGKHREFFERAYVRKHKYWPIIEEVFTARNIPIELGFMALVESGFNPRARSHANARGLWQFIPSTGRRYQLRRTDDFYDVRRATEAAAEYLLDLIGIFGSPSFLLATAAYNAGEGRIQRCLRDLEDPFAGRSFWEIRPCLARETREYVPRIMAAVVIGSDPRRFGFDLPSVETIRERYDVVVVPRPTSLTQLARQAGTTVAELRTVNTDLSPTATSTPVRNFPIYVPAAAGEQLASSLATSVADTRPASRPRPAEPVSTNGDATSTPTLYTVRSGDTLSQIAEQYRVSYRQLASWNGLEAPYRLRIGQQLAIYTAGGSPKLLYTVKRGNTLQAIANIFSVRYRDIMAWNDLERGTLQAGQKLIIHPSRAIRSETYRVRRGDSVAKIARRFGVPVRDVLTANGLGTRSVIRPGQRLLVYVS